MKKLLAAILAAGLTVSAWAFPVHTNLLTSINISTYADGTYKDFNWQWNGEDDQYIGFGLSPAVLTTTQYWWFRLCQQKGGDPFFTQNGNFGNSGSMTISRTNNFPDGTYYAEVFLTETSTNTTGQGRTVAQGKVTRTHSLFSNTNNPAWTNRVGEFAGAVYVSPSWITPPWLISNPVNVVTGLVGTDGITTSRTGEQFWVGIALTGNWVGAFGSNFPAYYRDFANQTNATNWTGTFDLQSAATYRNATNLTNTAAANWDGQFGSNTPNYYRNVANLTNTEAGNWLGSFGSNLPNYYRNFANLTNVSFVTSGVNAVLGGTNTIVVTNTADMTVHVFGVATGIVGSAYATVTTNNETFTVGVTGLWDTIAQTNFSNNVYAAFLPLASTNAYGSTQFNMATFLDRASTNAYWTTNEQAAATNWMTSTFATAAGSIQSETQKVTGAAYVVVVTAANDFAVSTTGLVGQIAYNDYTNAIAGATNQWASTNSPAVDWWNYPAQGNPELQQYEIKSIGALSFTPYSTGGMVWATSTTNAGWGARYVTRMIVFSNQMYVAGGLLAANTNDVLRSQNGTNWERVVQNAEWTPRYNHELAVISNTIVLAGGYTSTDTNDVWASSNYGTNWTMLTATAGWSKRRAFGMVTFNGRLAVFGGLSGVIATNDVWVSDNAGTTWSKINNASWSNRYAFAYTVHDNKLWVLGGINNSGTLMSDVYYTADLTNWVQTATAAGWNTRAYHGAESVGELMYNFGGFTGSVANAKVTKDIWSSADGISWAQESATLPVENTEFGHCVFSNYIYIYNGYLTNGSLTPAVFYGSTSSVSAAKIYVDGITNVVFTNFDTFHFHGRHFHLDGHLTITDGASNGYVFTSTNDAGDGAWQAPAAETQTVAGAAYVVVVTAANSFTVSSTGLWDTIAQTNFSNNVYAAFLPVASTNAYVPTNDPKHVAIISNVQAGANVTISTNGPGDITVAATAGSGAAQSPHTNEQNWAGYGGTNAIYLRFGENEGGISNQPGGLGVSGSGFLDLKNETGGARVFLDSLGAVQITSNLTVNGSVTASNITDTGRLVVSNLTIGTSVQPTNGAVLVATNTSGQAVWQPFNGFDASQNTNRPMAATWNLLTNNWTENKDYGNVFDPASGKFTPTVDGMYSMVFAPDCIDFTVASTYIYSTIYVATPASTSVWANTIFYSAGSSYAHPVASRVGYVPATGEWYYSAVNFGTTGILQTANGSYFGAALQR